MKVRGTTGKRPFLNVAGYYGRERVSLSLAFVSLCLAFPLSVSVIIRDTLYFVEFTSSTTLICFYCGVLPHW